MRFYHINNDSHIIFQNWISIRLEGNIVIMHKMSKCLIYNVRRPQVLEQPWPRLPGKLCNVRKLHIRGKCNRTSLILKAVFQNYGAPPQDQQLLLEKGDSAVEGPCPSKALIRHVQGKLWNLHELLRGVCPCNTGFLRYPWMHNEMASQVSRKCIESISWLYTQLFPGALILIPNGINSIVRFFFSEWETSSEDRN